MRTALKHIFILCLLLPVALQAASLVAPDRVKHAEGLALDSLGIVWASAGEDLFSWDGRHLMRQDSWDGWDGGRCQLLAAGDKGRLWIKAEAGLFVREERFLKVDLLSAVAQAPGNAMLVQDDILWMGTDRGLLRWHPQEGERVLLSGLKVQSLELLADGDLVCGTISRGLFRFEPDGNPAPIREDYQQLLPDILRMTPGTDGEISLLGRDANGEVRLATLGASGEELILQDETALPAGIESVSGMLKLGGRLLLRLDRDWLTLDDMGSWRIWHPRHDQPVTLPPGWSTDWPGMEWVHPAGRLEILMQESGMLIPRQEEMSLAWRAGGQSELVPVQYCENDGKNWVLLESQTGVRSLLEQEASGLRDLSSSLNLGDGLRLESICPAPGGQGLLLATSGGLYHLNDGEQELLTGSGLYWLMPFTSSAVLVAGEDGLALWEEHGALRPLKVRERVRLAVPDAFGGVLAACDNYLLHLNELNEVDTLSYPSEFEFQLTDHTVRNLLSDRSGRIWLLSGHNVYLRPREGAPWTQPFRHRVPNAEAEIYSIALDSRDQVWLSTSLGSGVLVPDRLPPVVRLLQDPRLLSVVDRKLELQLSTADPLSGTESPKLRLRLEQGKWSSWKDSGPIPLAGLLPEDLEEGRYQLEVQAMDAWGNLSRGTILPLVYGSELGRLPFMRRLFILLAMVGLSVLATLFYPRGQGLAFSLASGVLVGFWIFNNTNEPLLWWALPVIQLLTSKITTDQLRNNRRKSESEGQEKGITDLVDRFREFGHSGAATRNIDRLLRSSRNLYLDGVPDDEINGRFQKACGVYLDLTAPSLEELLKAFRRLPAGECPVVASELELYADLIREVHQMLESCGDPPGQSRLEELAFQLDRLEKVLGELEHRVDLQVSSSPLKVLDRVLENRSVDMAGVQLELECERDVRQVLARLPVDKLHFILDNLVDNALHWMVDRDVRKLSITVRERPSTLQIRIRDTGPGVPEALHERIFEAGYSGRGERDSGSGGYGLYRSRELLARFGGRLELEESEAAGSVFLLEVKKVEAETR